MIDFNRALVIHGFLKTLLCFLETLHKGACLLSTSEKVCAILNNYQVVRLGQEQCFDKFVEDQIKNFQGKTFHIPKLVVFINIPSIWFYLFCNTKNR